MRVPGISLSFTFTFRAENKATMLPKAPIPKESPKFTKKPINDSLTLSIVETLFKSF